MTNAKHKGGAVKKFNLPLKEDERMRLSVGVIRHSVMEGFAFPVLQLKLKEGVLSDHRVELFYSYLTKIFSLEGVPNLSEGINRCFLFKGLGLPRETAVAFTDAMLTQGVTLIIDALFDSLADTPLNCFDDDDQK